MFEVRQDQTFSEADYSALVEMVEVDLEGAEIEVDYLAEVASIEVGYLEQD